ncbi:MAG: hypothetical protein QW797_04265 [Thermoproteota archaeon]
MFKAGEDEEKIRRILTIIVLVSVALIAAVLVFFLATKVLTPPPSVYDFRLELNNTRVEVLPGKIVNTLITLVPEGAFQGSVTLKIETPEKIDCTVSNWVLNPSSRNTILILNTTGLAPGSYSVEVSGSYLEITRKVRLTLVVKEVEKPWFEASVTLRTPRIMQAERLLLNFSITPHAGFNENISIVIKGLPDSRVEPNIIGKGQLKPAVSVYTSRRTPVGVINFTIVLNSTSYETALNLTVEVSEAPPPSFQIFFSPNITMVKPGDTANIKVGVRPLYGFEEAVHIYSSYISLSLKEFNGSSFVLTPRNYSGVSMLMKTDKSLDYGVYDLTFIAESSSRREFGGLKIGVANVSSTYRDPAPGIIGYSPIVQASRGEKVVLNLLVGSLNGFEGVVVPRVNVTGLNLGSFYFSTGEGFPKMGVSVRKLNMTAGEAKFIFLSMEIRENVASGIYRINVELCVEYPSPNMAFPLLKVASVYTVELHID